MAEEVVTTTHLPKDQYQFKAGLGIPLVPQRHELWARLTRIISLRRHAMHTAWLKIRGLRLGPARRPPVLRVIRNIVCVSRRHGRRRNGSTVNRRWNSRR